MTPNKPQNPILNFHSLAARAITLHAVPSMEPSVESLLVDIIFRFSEDPINDLPFGVGLISQEYTKETLRDDFQHTVESIEASYPGIKVNVQHWVPLMFDLLSTVYIDHFLTDLTINHGVRIIMSFYDIIERQDDDILQAVAAGLLRETFTEKFNRALDIRHKHNLALYIDPVNVFEKLLLFFATGKILDEVQIQPVREFAKKVRTTLHCTPDDIRQDLNHIFYWEQSWGETEWDSIETCPERTNEHKKGRSVIHIYEDMHVCAKCNKNAKKKFRRVRNGRFVYYCSKECKE